MFRAALALALMLSAAVPAAATEFAPVSQRAEFLALIEGRDLRIGMFALSITLAPDGQITGSALGSAITGTWAWKDGYFCRELDWSGTPISYNCQLVEVRGIDRMRFTVDRGAGDSASFDLD